MIACVVRRGGPFLCPPGCAREGVSSREVQILPRLAYKPEAESNCVTKRWGGEQQEARESSVIK